MTDIIPVERIVFYLFFYHVNPPPTCLCQMRYNCHQVDGGISVHIEGDRPVHSTNESIFVIPVDVTFRKENGSTDIQQDHGD